MMIVPAGPSPLLDRVGIALSGLCVVHCVATSILLALMSAAGDVLGAPIVHEVGLALAILLGVVALGRGVLAHRRLVPLALGAAGVGLMGTALAVPHGAGEAIWTVAGVVLLGTAHVLNRRGCVDAAHR
ncbi:MerC domain-containing protein [Sphingomonas sp.]|jgi:hypothetical protein|uniref:MerC domain-containing protein n=1 Tax=Sphingomonas sp. TaxID=28214 RepID=UPI002ED88386